jgi:hypothetical protein
VRDQSFVEAMGWESGQRLTITASAGAVIIRRDPRRVHHPHHVPARDPRPAARPLPPAPR